MAEGPGQRWLRLRNRHYMWAGQAAWHGVGVPLKEAAEKLGAKRDQVKRNHQFMRTGQVQSMRWSSIVL